MHFKALLAYDGTQYYGWQKTRSGPTIQEALQKAIFQLTQETVLPEAASRTDRGVHAVGQVVQFSAKKEISAHQLNAVLPPDIRALQLETVPPSFHPTLDALEKEYHYKLHLGPTHDPTMRLYTWHIHQPLDIPKMLSAKNDLIGTHDFTAFAGETEANPICTITDIAFEEATLKIKGNRFLYKMARNIAGTLIDIARGKLSSDIPQLLQSRDRKKTGVTAPAHGLYLHQVVYPLKSVT